MIFVGFWEKRLTHAVYHGSSVMSYINNTHKRSVKSFKAVYPPPSATFQPFVLY